MSDVGRFVWYDLLTPDPEGAKAFYGAVVGWTTQPWEGDARPYAIWTAGGTPVGGVMKLLPEWAKAGEPPHWWAHVTVDDVDAAAVHAVQLGGKIRTPPTDIPAVGRFAIVADPQGAVISLFAPNDSPGTAAAAMEPGHVAWHELNTTDREGAWGFYAGLFGWKPTTALDMGEMGAYFMFRHPDAPEDAPMGGMFNAARLTRIPPHWLFYVTVGEMDAAVARIRANGGKVLNGPMDVPGGGRAAQCVDPQGALFGVFAMK